MKVRTHPRLRDAAPWAAALALTLIISACAHQPQPVSGADAPGFFHGLFQGAVAPITLFLGWLWDGRIYAFPNVGWFYDFGFMLGISLWGGGAASVK